MDHRVKGAATTRMVPATCQSVVKPPSMPPALRPRVSTAALYRRGPPRLATALYVLHAIVELVLGALKIYKGGYTALDLPADAARFARHHGVSLLCLGALGAECVRRRLIETETGALCSFVLFLFHAGTATVMAYHAHLPTLAMHAPFAVGFAWHAATVRV